MSSYQELLQKQKELAAQIEAARKQELSAAIDKVRTIIAEFDLKPEDVFGKGKKAGKTASAGPKVAPKYRDPETGATWTGRGKAPLWIATAPDRDAYLIKEDQAA